MHNYNNCYKGFNRIFHLFQLPLRSIERIDWARSTLLSSRIIGMFKLIHKLLPQNMCLFHVFFVRSGYVLRFSNKGSNAVIRIKKTPPKPGKYYLLLHINR